MTTQAIVRDYIIRHKISLNTSSFAHKEDGYKREEMHALALMITAHVPYKNPGDRPDCCVFHLGDVIKLLKKNEPISDALNNREYKDRTYYVTLLPLRTSNNDITDVLWSLLVSKRLSSGFFSHTFYSTYGQADPDKLHFKAKWYAHKISQFLAKREISEEYSNMHFEIIACQKNPMDRNSNLWLIEHLRYHFQAIILHCKPWTGSDIGGKEADPDIKPEFFSHSFVFDRKKSVWEKFLFHPLFGVPISGLID